MEVKPIYGQTQIMITIDCFLLSLLVTTPSSTRHWAAAPSTDQTAQAARPCLKNPQV